MALADVVFERAPLLAERLRAVPRERLIAQARAEIARMSEAERIAVLDAHPRIGAPAASLSDSSRREQGADADAATGAELARLNDEYERRFGFRFVVFVNGRSKREVVPVLRDRLAHQREEEMAVGLAEFLAISEDRLGRA